MTEMIKKITWWNCMATISLVCCFGWAFIAIKSEGAEASTAMIRSELNWLGFLVSCIGGMLKEKK